jgi:hypothetical protein
MEKGLAEIVKKENGMIEETVEEYFNELKKVDDLEEKIKSLKQEASSAKTNVNDLCRKIFNLLKETKSDTLLIERAGKQLIFTLNPNKDSIEVKEVITPKDLKTRLAVNKLGGKKSKVNSPPKPTTPDTTTEQAKVMMELMKDMWVAKKQGKYPQF